MLRRYVEPFLDALVKTPYMQALWNIRNGGVPLFVHTIDVAMLALDYFDQWQERYGPMSLLPTVVGALLHDLTKVTAQRTRGQLTHLSHSTLMRVDPLAAVIAAQQALLAVRDVTGLILDKHEWSLMAHIIESHHGPWGSVPPQCPEAVLVHYCDLYSARYHRQSPVDANDILELLDKGLSRTAAARILGVTPQLVNKRLAEACQAEWLDSVDELLMAWRRRGYIVTGSEEAQTRRQEIRLRAAEAARAPAPLLEHPTFVAWRSHDD